MFDLAAILAKINAFEQLVTAILTAVNSTAQEVSALRADAAATKQLVANLAPAQVVAASQVPNVPATSDTGTANNTTAQA